jgi:hypothetical protein
MLNLVSENEPAYEPTKRAYALLPPANAQVSARCFSVVQTKLVHVDSTCGGGCGKYLLLDHGR